MDNSKMTNSMDRESFTMKTDAFTLEQLKMANQMDTDVNSQKITLSLALDCGKTAKLSPIFENNEKFEMTLFQLLIVKKTTNPISENKKNNGPLF